MKLLVIMSIQEFVKDIRKALQQADIVAYSEIDIIGHKRQSGTEGISWFGSESDGAYSTMFFSFQTEECLAKVKESIKKLNESLLHEEKRSVHAYILNVESNL